MPLNDWEGRAPEFLESSFNGDAEDIAAYLTALDLGNAPVMEVGFGNNRLLRHLRTHKALEEMQYYGLDKTRTFVHRAINDLSDANTSFGQMDIENLGLFEEVFAHIGPKVLILRYIVEHLPKWREVLGAVNLLGPEHLLVSLFIESKTDKSWTESCKGYTYNWIAEKALLKALPNYSLVLTSRYPKITHVLRAFKHVRCDRAI